MSENLPKKYDHLCRPITEEDWFTGDKGDVIPTHCYAHYLNIKNLYHRIKKQNHFLILWNM